MGTKWVVCKIQDANDMVVTKCTCRYGFWDRAHAIDGVFDFSFQWVLTQITHKIQFGILSIVIFQNNQSFDHEKTAWFPSMSTDSFLFVYYITLHVKRPSFWTNLL